VFVHPPDDHGADLVDHLGVVGDAPEFESPMQVGRQVDRQPRGFRRLRLLCRRGSVFNPGLRLGFRGSGGGLLESASAWGWGFGHAIISSISARMARTSAAAGPPAWLSITVEPAVSVSA
jgi:hypothetical protein